MATTARRAAALLAAGLLAAATPAAAGAQDGSRLPVAAPGPVHDDPRVRVPRLPAGGRRGGLLPLDPDARGLVHRPRRPRPRSLHDRRRLHALTAFFFLPVPERGLRAAGGRRPAGGDGRPQGGPPPGGDTDPGDGAEPAVRERAAPDDTSGRPRGPGDGGDRARPEGPCFEVRVRLEGGGTHRIRIDGAALEAATPAAAAQEFRARTASRGALAVEGLDGASLHLDADRVRGLSVESCPAVVVP